MAVPIADSDLLKKVKDGLGIVGNYHDDALNVHIAEVKAYLRDAGIDKEIVGSTAAVGVIMRGVSDLWDFSGGELSEYFKQRATQLSLRSKGGEDGA